MLTRTQFWQSAVVGVAFAGAMFVGIQVGQASGPAASPAVVPEVTAPTTMRACVNKKSGAMRMPSGTTCKRTERRVTWNVKGVPGARGAAGAVTINGSKCTETQYIGYDGESWTCVSAPISAFLYADGSTASFSKVGQGFKAFSANVDADTGCNKDTCVIRLYDVVDHNSCSAELRGGTFATDAEVLPSTNNILIDFGTSWKLGQEVTIAITCLR